MTRPAKKKPVGCVAFVGAGPGDPSLLTLRAAALLASADVVVLERPAPAALLQHCGTGVEILDAAPAGAGAAKLSVDAAKAGKAVVRLIDGCPSLSATFAEEASACTKARVPIEVVPGVSAATGVPAYAGIPLTGVRSREVRVLDAATVAKAGADWSAHAPGTATLVLLDVAGAIGEVAEALMRGGRVGSTPVAMTHAGTTTEQATVVSTLERIAEDAAAAGISTSAVTVVGDVVGLRQKLSWFETKPLFGWRVLVPRTKDQAPALSAKLLGLGAVPVEVPTIAVEPPRTPQQVERAIKGLVTGRYEWVAFTSRNAVRAVREKFEEYGLDARAFSGIKLAAVGDQTAADLEAWGIKPDLVPAAEQSAAGLLEVWPSYDEVLDPINRVFLPRADIATETLVAGLVELGWEVDDVTAYRTVRAAPPPPPTRDAIKNGGFDAVLFTSSSTVRNLVGIAGKPHPSTVIACIGPQTAKAAEEHGLRVDVLASAPSSAALADSLAEYAVAYRTSAGETGEAARPSQRRGPARRRAT